MAVIQSNRTGPYSDVPAAWSADPGRLTAGSATTSARRYY